MVMSIRPKFNSIIVFANSANSFSIMCEHCLFLIS